MKILMLSNFMNHHQRDFCDCLHRNSEAFSFVCLGSMPESTLKFGYDDLSSLPYVIPFSSKSETWLTEAVDAADVVIFGDSSYQYLDRRMRQNKLSFIFSERVWKKGYYRRWIPRCRKKVTDRFSRYKENELYVLAASCYLAQDLEMVGFPGSKCFKWGYFTPFEKIDSPESFYDRKDAGSILWAGRLIPLKHLEELLEALANLKNKGCHFNLTVIGDGPERRKWQDLSRRMNLETEVMFKGSMSSAAVREEMKKNRIFVATSDFNEGWGAVINEGMNSVCVPVVSHAMGASAFLISPGRNGCIYKSGDVKSLEKCLTHLFEEPDAARRMAVAACDTISTEYNGFVAGKRFMETADCLLRGDAPPEYGSGPMSLSPLLKNNWIGKSANE